MAFPKMNFLSPGSKLHKNIGFPIMIDTRQFMGDADLLSVGVFRLARQLGDMTEPLTTSIKYVVSPSIQRNFLLGGRPFWEGLSLKRLNDKLTISPSLFHTLVYSGAMYFRATGHSIWRITKTSADMEALDTVIPYAKYHQQGTKNMPARPFAVLQLKDIEGIVIVFDSWIRLNMGKRDFWPYTHGG